MKITKYTIGVNRVLGLQSRMRWLHRLGIAHPRSGVVDRRTKETREMLMLSPCAFQGSQSLTRLCVNSKLPTIFERDAFEISSSILFRRLSGKTQVLINPQQEHITTRLFHTMTVANISRIIARALGLNEALVEAIAIGHDLGHTPFGHAGERALGKISQEYLGISFRHNRLSQFIADEILHLSFEVQDGILRHSGKLELVNTPTKTTGADLRDEKINAATLEGVIVKIADKLASAVQDLMDLQSAGIFKADLKARNNRTDDLMHRALLSPITAVLGEKARLWMSVFIDDVIENSRNKNAICFSQRVFDALQGLMALNKGIITGKHENVHFEGVKEEDDKVEEIIFALHKHFTRHYHNDIWSIKDYYFRGRNRIEVVGDELIDICVRAAIHRVAGLTDRMAIEEYLKLSGADRQKVPGSAG